MSDQHHTCLLIDDDQDDREIFQMALEELGSNVNCVTSRDGIEGLKLLSSRSIVPDYIFLDMNMPLMNGEECLIEIRKLDHLAAIPVYVYTTSSDKRNRPSFLEKGAKDVLTKPAKLSELVKVLGNIMS